MLLFALPLAAGMAARSWLANSRATGGPLELGLLHFDACAAGARGPRPRALLRYLERSGADAAEGVVAAAAEAEARDGGEGAEPLEVAHVEEAALARAVEAAKAHDDKPNEQALAFATASSSEEVGAKTHMMGPKISSCAILAVIGTSTNTVGGKNDVPINS